VIHRPYTNTNAIPGTGGDVTGTNTAPSTSLLGSFLTKLPYAYQIIDSIIQKNPKYDAFKNVSPKRDEYIQDESVFLQQDASPHLDAGIGAPGSLLINKDYQNFVYANIDKDKFRRLQDYRRMAAYAELSDCINEIADECLVKDENDEIVKCNLRGDYPKEVKNTVEKEFKKFISIFDIENKGWDYFRQFLVDGELLFENIIDSKHPDYGIIGLINLPTELVNPVYNNVQNENVKGFLLRKPTQEPSSTINKKDQEEIFFLQQTQVTYIHSGIWNEFKTLRLPFIENAKRAYRLLSLIEDSVVIYRLVRAPERLKFKIYTGSMPGPKAEAFLKRMMQAHWTKKNYDTQQGSGGRTTNVYDPQSMLDAYWFTKDAQGNGNDVETMPSGGNLGEIKELDYFLKKLYNSLSVPIGRFMVADSPFKDGKEITREELRFARFIIRIQRQFAIGIKESFIAHLKLKGLYKQYKIRERYINVDFNVPTSFMAMREQEVLELKFNNYQSAINTNTIAPSYAQKYFLGWTDELMKENREWQKKDAALKWELTQIEAAGPNFRELAQAQLGGGEGGGESGFGGGGAPMGSSGGGGPTEAPGAEGIPEFGGGAPEAGGGPETGAAAPETPAAGAGANEAPTQSTPTQ
jgi:hypothetical protein